MVHMNVLIARKVSSLEICSNGSCTIDRVSYDVLIASVFIARANCIHKVKFSIVALMLQLITIMIELKMSMCLT